jgi:predicted ATPase/DNA-binding CsgD family transcriptional regulator
MAARGYGTGVEGSAADTAAAGVRGFPVVLTSFVGREQAVREVAGLLAEYRLVTVTGAGGMGKTRLAGEVARRVAGGFADEAWLAELAPVDDPARVASAVAVALGVREQPGVPAAETLTRVLVRRQLLVVLDNCEHVIGAVAQLCAGLLPACDDMRILATSREPLRVAGEAAYRLAPLPVPGPDGAGDDRAGAVALFADRARAADAGFTLKQENRADVARLVGRLDGMPLAIELAAARAEALGISQLAGLLEGRLGLLGGGDRLAAGRHRSLAAVAEWSYQLLAEAEQRVFRLLSVFPAPFTLEAATAVAGDDATPVVLRLVECSLLVAPRAGPDGRLRYALLETLRDYGAGLLADAGEQDQAQAALARYAVGVAEQAAAGLASIAGELAAARWLDAEAATTDRVLAWAANHDLDAAARLVTALGPWWLLRGRLAGQEPLLVELAGRAGAGSQAWCTAQFWLAWNAFEAADMPGALRWCDAVIDRAGSGEPSPVLADCLAQQSVVLATMGRVPEAAAAGHRALAMARELGYPFGEVNAVTSLAIAVGYAGDQDEAARLARQGGQIPDIPRIAARICDYVLAAVLADAGDLAAAGQACAVTLAQSRDAGDLNVLGAILPVMADLDLRAGRTGDAAAHLRETAQIALQNGHRLALLNTLVGCGYLRAATGHPADAVTAWSAYKTLGRQGGMEDADTDTAARRLEEDRDQARQALGPEQARAAEQRGAAMSLATAAEYALLLTAPGTSPAQGLSGAARLSARERELVTLVAQGRTDAQIAGQLFISIRTVRSHLDRIRDKTGCRRRADLTRLALAAGLV